MQIKIEIDVQPEELRRFLGLPDMAGLQEDLIHFLREKLVAAGETFDPAAFVKENIGHIKRSRTLRRILYGEQAARGGGKSRARRRAQAAEEAAPAGEAGGDGSEKKE
ncbi:MAG: hypothetical protein HYV18_02920 [Gammaproteobacteria bacterium]|nr:hypothetical protein [Gammaproteobacteria bacterium]